jgi:hypothetical protein
MVKRCLAVLSAAALSAGAAYAQAPSSSGAAYPSKPIRGG